MDFLEKDLEDIIYGAYKAGNQKELRKRGLLWFKHDHLIRQLNLGDYGTADLVGISMHPTFDPDIEATCIVTIYELKKDIINLSTFNQMIKYGEAISRFVDENNIYGCVINYVLIGRYINPNTDNLCFLKNALRNVKTFTYRYDVDGIKFDETKNYRCGNGNTGKSLDNMKKFLQKIYVSKRIQEKKRLALKYSEGLN